MTTLDKVTPLLSGCQRGLLRLIEEAFRGVKLGDGVSLHETVVLDNYGSAEQRRAARAPDEKHDWRKLVGDPELLATRGVGGLSFYDAAGFRFHLPAYLTVAVVGSLIGSSADDLIAELEFHLASLPHYDPSRDAVLDAPQRACVLEVLKYRRGMYPADFDTPGMYELDQAIRHFWAPGSESTGTAE